MDLQVIGGGKVTVADGAFAREFNSSLVHQAVTAFLAGGRAGTKAQKNRSAVRGGGAKPWRQKGTGRARAGTSRSPIWRSGGVTFAAQPRDYAQKINKKMYRAAISSIFSELIRTGNLAVIEGLQLDSPKTRVLASKLADIDAADALILTDEIDENLLLASRNLPRVEVLEVSKINPVALLRNKKVLITKAALDQLGAWLG